MKDRLTKLVMGVWNISCHGQLDCPQHVWSSRPRQTLTLLTQQAANNNHPHIGAVRRAAGRFLHFLLIFLTA